MSKRDKRKSSETREPWEQSIYDTDNNAGSSRSEKRQQGKGNTAFLTILVILLLLIISIPVGTYLYVVKDNKPAAKTASESSSVVVQSSTKESTSDSTAASQTQASSEDTAVSGSAEADANDTTGAVYTEVLSGEGPNQVAARNGITTDELLQLNDLSLNSVLQPGQSLRVK